MRGLKSPGEVSVETLISTLCNGQQWALARRNYRPVQYCCNASSLGTDTLAHTHSFWFLLLPLLGLCSWYLRWVTYKASGQQHHEGGRHSTHTVRQIGKACGMVEKIKTNPRHGQHTADIRRAVHQTPEFLYRKRKGYTARPKCFSTYITGLNNWSQFAFKDKWKVSNFSSFYHNTRFSNSDRSHVVHSFSITAALTTSASRVML